MGLIISAAGAAVMVLGIVLFILQAGKISSQAKKDADRGEARHGRRARKHWRRSLRTAMGETGSRLAIRLDSINKKIQGEQR